MVRKAIPSLVSACLVAFAAACMVGGAWAEEPDGRTLVDRGDLRGSVTYRVLGDGAVEVGAAREYAAIHQMGGTITAKGKALRFRLATSAFVNVRSVRIPARPYLGISAEDREEIVGTVEDAWRLALAAGAAGPAPGPGGAS